MFAARNLRRHCLKSLSTLLQFNLYKYVVSLGHMPELTSSKVLQIQLYEKATVNSNVKPFYLFNGSSRAMSTSKGRSMRSKVERRMQKESGKTLREIRRAKKLKKKLMTEEERLVYNLKRAKKKAALLLQKLKKYELPELPSPRHDPELFTPEQLQAYKKIGFRNKNYVPVGVRGVFGGVVQNMHLHWKFHETVQVCCDNFPKEKIKEMAAMLARLSGGIVINIHNVKTIIMFRGRNYRQPKNLIPINTLTKRKALFKARFEQALESQKLNIKKIEQQLRRMGVNPEDPTAMASIQRVASTFFNAIDKKEGSPYVFREGGQSTVEHIEGLEHSVPSVDSEQSETSVDSDQEELDRFIAEIEDAADKEYEAEEAKDKEEHCRIRYWNREEFGGRIRRSDASRNDDYDGDIRGSRAMLATHPKHQATDSNDEEDAYYDNDDEKWHSDDSNETRGRFKGLREGREKRNNIGGTQVNESSKIHAEAKFGQKMAGEDSESEGMFSDVENAMWESDEEENESQPPRWFGDNYKSSSDDEYVFQIKDHKNGVRDHEGKYLSSNRFDALRSVRVTQEGSGRGDLNQCFKRINSESDDIWSNTENRMWHSDAEEDSIVSRTDQYGKRDIGEEGDYHTRQNSDVVKSDINHGRTPKAADEAWDSD